MTRLPKILSAASAVLALAGCAGQQVYEETPHHFSQDAQGNRVACFATEVASEYECVPVVRRYDRGHGHGHGYGYYYDPFWSHRFLFGWPYPYRQVIVVREPGPRPQPPPHFRPRKGKN